MKKLAPPTYDDNAALDSLGSNKRLDSYPRLLHHLPKLKAGYAHYVAANGNVSAVQPVTISKVTARFLRGYYGSPPAALSYITTMREESDSNTCPMCGSLHSGTLDHVMDKDSHPAFSVFTQNLVPACKCNSKRLKPLVGANPGERILHPYFDTVLAQRIVAARFTDLGPVPHVETRIVLDATDPHYAATIFHHNSVVMRTSIHGYLARNWAAMLRRPALAVPDLKRDPISRNEMVAMIQNERDRTDDARESRNNWDSVYLSGLLDDDVIDWLYQQIGRPGRRPGGPLF
ncbi:hypothetical protein [Sphingomonas abietis]|uniref:HNH endonuclease n=1 Tax=Sphingomonas abietis TaxID=3012344 RepID=A0ABY7NPK7_9SPHN|nr:hypothetical protein [Sphingomonas abietis]WBO22725.1 hypothetical protein PBT88_00785 [Sphingomonas abietis]